MNDIAKPLITTIIPTYRRPKLLQRAIKSVLNQTYPHFRVCVCDNASGDETASVVTEMAKNDSRIKYYCHSENIGAIRNFAYGMEHVETPFFSFLSDDDLLLPCFFQTTVNIFRQHPEAMLVATGTVSMEHSGKIKSVDVLRWQEGLYKPHDGLLEMINHRPPVWTGTLFRSDVIDRVGGLDIGLPMAIDGEFMLRIAAHYPYYVSQKLGAIFYTYRTHGTHSAGFNPLFQENWDKMIEKVASFGAIPLSIRQAARGMLVEWKKSAIKSLWKRYMGNGDYDSAIKCANLLSDDLQMKVKADWMRWVALLSKNNFICRAIFRALKVIRTKLLLITRYGHRRKLAVATRAVQDILRSNSDA